MRNSRDLAVRADEVGGERSVRSERDASAGTAPRGLHPSRNDRSLKEVEKACATQNKS
jgi:hypothetical protein